MNDKLISRLLACICVTSLAIAAATGPFASPTGRAGDASANSAANPATAAQSRRTHFDVFPFPAPQIDPSLPAPEPAPTF